MNHFHLLKHSPGFVPYARVSVLRRDATRGSTSVQCMAGLKNVVIIGTRSTGSSLSVLS